MAKKKVLKRRGSPADNDHRGLFAPLIDNMSNGFAYHKVILNRRGVPVDYRFLEVNKAFEKIIGIKRNKIVGKKVTELFPGINKDPGNWIGKYGKVALSGRPIRFEQKLEALNRWYNISAYSPKKEFFAVLFNDITKQKSEKEKIAQLKQETTNILDNIDGGFIAIDTDWRYLYINKIAAHNLNSRPEKLIGKNIWEKFPNLIGTKIEKSLRQVMVERTPLHFEDQGVETSRWYENHIYPTPEGLAIFWVDISERKKKEEELKKLNRTLKALSESNYLIMQARDEKEYLNDVCRTIIKNCGYKMVWIGCAEDDKNKTVRPMASAGFEKGYLENINVSWGDNERGRGPTGTAIRTGKMTRCRNMLTDPKFAPWRDQAIKRGYSSSIVFPLKTPSKVLGAVSIYSKEPDPFTDNEIKLLSELANDLTIGLNALRLRREAEHMASFPRLNIMPVMEMDLEGNMVYANPAAQRVFSGIMKKGIKHEIFTDVNRDILKKKNKPLFFETKIKNRWFSAAATRMIDAGRIRVYCMDITMQMEALIDLSKEKNLLKIVLENTNVQIAYLSNDFKYVAVNSAYEKSCGYSAANLTGRNYFDIFPSAENKEIFKRVIESGERIEFKARQFAFADQSEQSAVYWDWNLSPVKDKTGRVYGLVMSLVDVTERLMMEERQRNFIAVLGHELRNPLTSITLATDLIAAQKTKMPAIQEELDVIGHQAGNMARLLRDLLDVSRLERGRLELEIEEVDLAKLINDAVYSIWPIVKNSKRQIKISGNAKAIKISADCLRIEQIIVNLLSNAVKYSNEGDVIDLSIKKWGDDVLMIVRDRGIGIAAAKICNIFDLFCQGTQSVQQKRSAGLGVGLYIARELARLHGGDVTVRSGGENKGSEFTLRLPMLKTTTETPAEQRGKKISAKKIAGKLRVLSVDDNVTLSKFINRSLRVLGYEALTVYDGKSALEVIKDFKPHFALLDLSMPGMDGFELAKRIKKDKKTAGVILAAISGFGQDTDKAKAKRAGFEYYIVKPVRVADLAKLLAGEKHNFKL